MKTNNYSGNVTIIYGTKHLICSKDEASMYFIYFSAFGFNKIVNKLSEYIYITEIKIIKWGDKDTSRLPPITKPSMLSVVSFIFRSSLTAKFKTIGKLSVALLLPTAVKRVSVDKISFVNGTCSTHSIHSTSPFVLLYYTETAASGVFD